MSNRTIEQIFVGAVVAIITAIINLSISGKINYQWVILGFFVAIVCYWIYQGFGIFPFKKFRVTTNREDGISLLADSSKGRHVEDGAWLFSDSQVYGPYLRTQLGKGKYTTVFKIKVDNLDGGNRYLMSIDIITRLDDRRHKTLASRTLTNRDFKKAGEYHYFPLDFYIIQNEQDLEMRVGSEGVEHNITLDYVQLLHRLF